MVVKDGSIPGTDKAGRILDSSRSLMNGLGHLLTWLVDGWRAAGFMRTLS